MRIIKGISIEGFRSIQAAAVGDLSGLNAFVGANNTGKSNVLRALALFFTGEPEPGANLDPERDFFYKPRSKKKKKITIEVEFEIPQFKYNPRVKSDLAKLGNRFRIRKSWSLEDGGVLSARVEPGGHWDPALSEAAEAFLRMVTFRYIPNRIVPSAALLRESKAISEALAKQLRGTTSLDQIAKDLDTAIDKMTQSVGKDIAAATSTVQAVQANRSSPTVSRLLGYTGFAATSPLGSEIPEANWGSGLQAFLMFLYLSIVDQSAFRQNFGWKQATIWAVEEPESSLHRDLAIKLAEKFREWSSTDRYRLQIFSTTHNDVFTMTASTGFFVRMKNGITELTNQDIARLTRMSAKEGVTSWSHPILSHPLDPVVLVEGRTDAEVLSHAARVTGIATHLRFVSLKDLDDETGGNGADQMAKYVDDNRGLLRSRPVEAPFFAVFDWDVPDSATSPYGKAKTSYENALPGAGERVIRMDEAQSNPNISADVRGLERFYPTVVFDALAADGTIQKFVGPGGVFNLGAKEPTPKQKALLRERMLETVDPAAFEFLVPLLDRLSALVAEAAQSQASLDAALIAQGLA